MIDMTASAEESARNSGAFKMIGSWNTIYNTLFVIAQVLIAYNNSARIQDTLY